MALLLTIIALSVALIVLLLFIFNGVVPYDQSKVFLVPLLLKILFLFILVGGLLWFIGVGRSGGFLIGWFQIFGSRLLGLGFFGS